jgi:hypothetical protein
MARISCCSLARVHLRSRRRRLVVEGQTSKDHIALGAISTFRQHYPGSCPCGSERLGQERCPECRHTPYKIGLPVRVRFLEEVT